LLHLFLPSSFLFLLLFLLLLPPPQDHQTHQCRRVHQSTARATSCSGKIYAFARRR
jgi:hypothetical protein